MTPSFLIGQAIGTNVGKAFQNISDRTALDDILENANRTNDPNAINDAMTQILRRVSPEKQQMAIGILQNKQKMIQDKLERENVLKQSQSQLSALEQTRGLEKGSLSGFGSNVKLAEQATRPQKEKAPLGGLSGLPVSAEDAQKIRKVLDENKNANSDELALAFADEGLLPGQTDRYVENRRRTEDTEAKREESRYNINKDFINETTQKYNSFITDTKPKLMQMQNIPDEDLVSPTAAKFLELFDIPLGALEDPASELYQKLSLDLLKGLPESFGNRILKVEVDNFLKTIPSLMNSADGRRMIASNMLKLGEMKEVYYNEMRKQQAFYRDKNKPLPLDFQQEVFDQVRPQINRINNEFVKLSEIKSVPEGTVPFFNPSGDIEFVPKEHAQWALENGGRRIW